MSDESGGSIGTARLDVVVDASKLDASIRAAEGRFHDMSSAAKQAYDAVGSVQQKQIDSLYKQADLIGKTRQEQILYNAQLKNLPTAVLDDLKGKLLAVAQANGTLGESTEAQTARLHEMVSASMARANAENSALAASQRVVSAADAEAVALAKAATAANDRAGIAQRSQAILASQARAQQQSASAAQEEATQLQKLLGKIDPVNAALERLDGLEAQLRAARGRGAISTDDFNAYAATIARTRSEITGADTDLKHFSLSAAGARRELAVMVGEVLQGNFANFEGSLATLANRSGLLAAALTPVGILVLGLVAALGALAAGAYAGASEQSELNRAIISTGDYAGVTTGQVNAMAETIGRSSGNIGMARDALQSLVASGKVAGDHLQEAAQGAVDFSEATGKSIDEAAKVFAQLQDEPVKAIRSLDEQYHILTLAQYENIKALQAQGDADAAAAIAQTAAAQAFAERAAQVRNDMGTLERAAHSVRSAFGGMWEAIKNVGRPTTLGEDVAFYNKQADDYKQSIMDSFHLTSEQAEKNGVVAAARAKARALQAGADLEQRAAQADAERTQMADEAKKASDTMSKYLDSAKADSVKAAEVAAVKAATLKLISNNPGNKAGYLADEKTALAAIEKKYTNHEAASVNRADASAQSASFKASIASLVDAYKNGQSELDAARKAGEVSEADYYQQSQALLWKNESDQVTAIQAEIDRLKTRKAVGAERIKLDSQISQLVSQAAKAEADAISKSEQLASQQKASYQKRQQAIDAYRVALEKANVALRGQIDAEVAQVGMGDRAFQQQQKINQAYAEQAAKLQDLALKLQAGSRGEVGGIDQDQYEADVEALRGATEEKVAILSEGYRRQKEAEADWLNGLKRGYANWADQASDVAGQVASETTSFMDGFANATVQSLNRGKDGWHDFALSVIEDLEKIALKMEEQAILSGVLSYFSGGFGASSGAGDALNGGANYTGSGSLSTGWAGQGGGWKVNAMGDVYDSPSLGRYSNEVYDSPHLFKFAKGAGIFGEAGPEAIMPLARGSNGKLGVQVTGGGGNGSGERDGGGNDVKVEVINNTTAPARTESGVDANGQEWVRVVIGQAVTMAVAEVDRRIARGESTGQTIGRTYGLSRRGFSVGGN